jgi:hypothetical protein
MGRTLATSIAAAWTSLAVVAFGCGGHSVPMDAGPVSAGETTVQGSVGGISLPAAYALAIPDNSNADSGPTKAFTTLSLGIANKPFDCSTAGLPNSTLIGISIKSIGYMPVGIGSYAIDLDSASPYDNLADLVTTDATCDEVSPSSCIGGTVTITEVTATTMTGTFELAFDTGEALHGTFNAGICASVPPSLAGASC